MQLCTQRILNRVSLYHLFWKFLFYWKR